MTELLSREKEFVKLNEQLDKLTTKSLEHHNHNHLTATNNTSSHASASSNGNHNSSSNKSDPRFMTYSKGKGQSTLLKKRGAGDGGIDGSSARILHSYRSGGGASNGGERCHTVPRTTKGSSTPMPQTLYSYTARDTPPPSWRSHGHHVSSGGGVCAGSGAVGGGHSYRDSSNTQANHQPQGPPAGTMQNRRSTRTNDSSRTHRSSHGHGSLNTSTFTVRYRNPNFVESPSLEVLVKDGNSSERNLSPKEPTDLESVSSIYTKESTGRRCRATPSLTKKHVSAEGLIKFLKSKIVILEEDHDRISQEMATQKELLEKTLERHKKAIEQRDMALSKNSSLSEQLSRTEAQLDETKRRIKERLVESSSQQKDLEMSKREIKLITQTNMNLEKRLFRASEELENAKKAILVMKNVEREMKETMRCELESKDKQIKNLKKQRADLLNAYKKQLYLIDNLKRQNICMEQSGMVQFSEKEFAKVLDWNTKT